MKKLIVLAFCFACFLSLWSCKDSYFTLYPKKWEGRIDIRVVNTSNSEVKLLEVYMVDTKNEYSKFEPKDTISVFSFENISKLDTSEVKRIEIKDKSKIGDGFTVIKFIKNNGNDTLEARGYSYHNFYLAENFRYKPSYMDVVISDSTTVTAELPEIYIKINWLE